MADFKAKLKGTVIGNFRDDETKKVTMTFDILPETIDSLEDKFVSEGLEWSGDRYPIKTDKEGNAYFKASSNFPVQVQHLEKGYTFDDIGKGSEVTAYVSFKEGVYQRRKYVSAYLIGVDVHSLTVKEETECFDSDDFQEI